MVKVNSLQVVLLFAVAAIVTVAQTCGPYQNSPTYLLSQNSGTLVSYPSSVAVPSSFTYQSLTFSISSTGIFTVSESNGNVVFSIGSATTCSATSRCTLSFQNDGNLVLYTPSGATFASNTYNGQGRYVAYQTSPPYISVLSSACAVLWPSAARGNANILKNRTTPVLGALNAAKVSYSQVPLPAPKWRSSFGANSHMSQGWDSTMTKNMAIYLGVGVLRDDITTAASGTTRYNDYMAMKSAGIKLDSLVGGPTSTNTLAQQVQRFATFQTTFGMLESLEGFNEINNFGFDYNGIDHTQSYKGMYQAMADFYALVKGNNVLKSLPVYDMTAACYAPASDNLNCYNISGRADIGNIHWYPFNGVPSRSLTDGVDNFPRSSAADSYGYTWTSANNIVTTETGYHTDSFANGISETAQAKLIVTILLNSLQFGIRKTFIYEMWDEDWANYDGQEEHFGLFRHDQTPKPAAKALHFLSELLKDTGAGSTTSVTYSLTNFPYSGQRLLLQNTAKTYFLVLWNNLPVWNPISNTDITNSATTATLTLAGTTSISVYDIYSSASDAQSLPALTTVNGTSISFSFADKPVVIKFNPFVAATPIPATVAPTRAPTAAPTKAPTPRPATATPRPATATPRPATATPRPATPTPPACDQTKYQLMQNNALSSTATQPAMISQSCVYGLYISNSDGSVQIRNVATQVVSWNAPLWSPTGQTGPFSLTMQADGNLVLYTSSSPNWASGTGQGYGYAGPGPYWAELRSDGKLRLIDGNNAIFWTSS